MSKPPICWVCHRTDFKNWQEVYDHMEEKSKIKSGDHYKNRSAQRWMKKFKHRNAINKLKKIGKKDEFEPRQKLTPEQLEARRESKYKLSNRTKLVSVKCPRCKNTSRQFLEIEHVDNPEALKEGNCYLVLCGGCK